MSSVLSNLDKNNGFEGTFRNAIWPLLMVIQLFGIMPVIGVTNESLSNLYFKWKSFRTIYALFVIMVFASHALIMLWKMIVDVIELDIFGVY